jgi:hypothetical protein
MRPLTLHYVLTMDHSITYGGHFYAASTIDLTFFTIAHLTVGNAALTNIDHPKARGLLRRMLSMFIDQFNAEPLSETGAK